MSNKITFGAGLWMFGSFVDRYASDGYGPEVDTLNAIKRVGEVDEIKVVDINYPFGGDINTSQVKEAFAEAGIKAHAVTPHIYMKNHVRGSLTHPDPKVRQGVIDLYKEALEVADELKPEYVKFWPGQDGYDYPFQADYNQLWEYSVNGIREVAEFAPHMKFAIEYKSKEPRTHMFFENASKTLLAIQDMGVDNVGVVMDVGHSFFAKETPAEIIQLLHRRGKLFSIEINDNWREWDDDMTAGSVHLIETLEALLAIRNIGWDKPILLDQFPFREDPVRAAKASIDTISRLDALIDRIDLNALKAAQDAQDALAAQKLVLDVFLS
jgi:xylose isomerase